MIWIKTFREGSQVQKWEGLRLICSQLYIVNNCNDILSNRIGPYLEGQGVPVLLKGPGYRPCLRARGAPALRGMPAGQLGSFAGRYSWIIFLLERIITFILRIRFDTPSFWMVSTIFGQIVQWCSCHPQKNIHIAWTTTHTYYITTFNLCLVSWYPHFLSEHLMDQDGWND